MAGRQIYKRRDQLQGFLNPLNENPFVITETEVIITHEERVVAETGPADGDKYNDYNPYSVNIEVNKQEKTSTKQLPTVLRMREITRTAAITSKNAEAWLYARVAFLFFVVILITWVSSKPASSSNIPFFPLLPPHILQLTSPQTLQVPSSINRFNSLVHPESLNFPLNYISSLVLPLQGFWNVIVYIITSQSACRHLWQNIFHKRGRKIEGIGGGNGGGKVGDKKCGDIRLDRFSRLNGQGKGGCGKDGTARGRFDSDGTSVVSLARGSARESREEFG